MVAHDRQIYACGDSTHSIFSKQKRACRWSDAEVPLGTCRNGRLLVWERHDWQLAFLYENGGAILKRTHFNPHFNASVEATMENQVNNGFALREIFSSQFVISIRGQVFPQLIVLRIGYVINSKNASDAKVHQGQLGTSRIWISFLVHHWLICISCNRLPHLLLGVFYSIDSTSFSRETEAPTDTCQCKYQKLFALMIPMFIIKLVYTYWHPLRRSSYLVTCSIICAVSLRGRRLNEHCLNLSSVPITNCSSCSICSQYCFPINKVLARWGIR